MKNCCYVYRAVRWVKDDVPLARFTCPTCGRSYIWRDWQWQPISTADDIKDMMEQEHARQHRDK